MSERERREIEEALLGRAEEKNHGKFFEGGIVHFVAMQCRYGIVDMKFEIAVYDGQYGTK